MKIWCVLSRMHLPLLRLNCFKFLSSFAWGSPVGVFTCFAMFWLNLTCTVRSIIPVAIFRAYSIAFMFLKFMKEIFVTSHCFKRKPGYRKMLGTSIKYLWHFHSRLEHPSNQFETSIQDEYHSNSCLGSIRVDKFNEIHLDWNGQSYLMEVPNLFLQPGSLVKHCHMYYTGN